MVFSRLADVPSISVHIVSCIARYDTDVQAGHLLPQLRQVSFYSTDSNLYAQATKCTCK